jgi:phosphoglucosamine mutase
MIDAEGNILDGDELLYIIIKHRIEFGVLKGGVVGTVMSNIGLENALLKLNIPFIRVPVGDRHIMAELGKRQWCIGGEPSGHIICFEALTTGDGIITALQVLCAMRHKSQTLSELKKGLQKYPQILLNVKVDGNAGLLEKPRIQAMLKNVENELGKTGRVLLRKSGTESLIRVMVEGEDEIRIKELANQLADTVRAEVENAS